MSDDEAAIESLVRRFFRAFSRGAAASGELDALVESFVPGGTITTFGAAGLVTDSVADFVRPRRALLLGASLRDFEEHETEGATLLGADVACRKSRYAKRGVRDGAPFTGAGTKVFSFARVSGAWRIASLLWQDDP